MADTHPGDGNAERLRLYWLTGPGAARIKWGTPHDFDRCVAELSPKYMSKRQAEGFCNRLHQRAVGAPPGKGHG